jgi:hypothetical protein
MRTTISAATALKIIEPAKTIPINRLKTINILLFLVQNCEITLSVPFCTVDESSEEEHRPLSATCPRLS